MFDKVLIANRGAIARRIIRTLRRMGISSVAVYSEADIGSAHVAMADEAVLVGPAPPALSYLAAEAIVAAAIRTGAKAIHPGYGFLSENAAFAERCAASGIVFIGPRPGTIRAFGLKHEARALAIAQGLRLAPGSGLLADSESAAGAARAIGYPVILKATAGGGGIGMRVCDDEAALRENFDAVIRLGEAHFGDGGVFLERYVAKARHIEVQVFGDGQGRVVALGERDCSLQRRNQKVIEETPAPNLPEATRAALLQAAVRLMESARYQSAGTVEFLYDSARDEFFFLEVNTRLQVEHGVTEQTTGVDLVEWMVRQAAGESGVLDRWSGRRRGASIEARLYAEDPAQGFRPSSGTLTEVVFPDDARVDHWIGAGSEISALYDPMLAKIIVTAPDRPRAVAALQRALDATRLSGIETNLDWLRIVARDPAFVSGDVSTRALSAIAYAPNAVQVIAGGPATTVQDCPGRLGFWSIGVPPSGPMDSLSFRLGNRLLGNAEGAAGLEFTAAGPTLLFNAPARVCMAGAAFDAMLDGQAVEAYAPFNAAAGQMLKIGRVRSAGLRGYLLVAGGFDTPSTLGSQSTFTLGGFGGHAGRAIAAGDVLRLRDGAPAASAGAIARKPPLSHEWTVRVLSGPHGAPDFFTEGDIAMIAQTPWRVHHNSNRTGIRLTGPKPQWARQDGGEAGLHPSNIHDNPYVVGAVDFTGDMPIILGPDGPSLGGFVCPFAIIEADLWRIGQMAPGDSVRFVVVDDAGAAQAARAQSEGIASPRGFVDAPAAKSISTPSPVVRRIPAGGGRPEVVFRRQGEHALLVEYGPIALDIELRLRIHALMLAIEALRWPEIIDLTPGIRSLQIHYDGSKLARPALLDALEAADARLGDLDDFEIPSRIIHLPLSWDDPAVRETVQKYSESVRDDAPWQPDNIEFIRRINGLASVDEVRNIVFDATYLVMGLGDVYLGAPVATPLDPRHRLVTTKYNPARTWTPPNVVGIGGAYLCIYGMEGPGGYQLFGRTIQVWSTHRQTESFGDGKPWLLRFFDQIRFYPVSADELTAWRREFPLGRREVRIEPALFRARDYRAFCHEHREGIAAFEAKRREAFAEERSEWERRGEFSRVAELSRDESADEVSTIVVPEGSEIVEAPFGGVVWRISVKVGDRVGRGDAVAVVEAMKMECPVHSAVDGVVRQIFVKERQPVQQGTPLVAVEPHR
jgi:urea carboxylase